MRSHTQRREKAGADLGGVNARRRAASRQVEAASVVIRSELPQGLVLILPIRVVSTARQLGPERGDDLGNPYQAVAARIGQGPQQDGVYHAEDGGVGADAQRQREHGHRGESRVSAQLAKPVAQVLNQCLHHGPTPLLTVFFLYLFHPAELAQRRVPSVLRQHPPAHVLLSQHCEVRAHFVGKV